MLFTHSRSLGITQWLIKEGLAEIEEVRASDGTLENLYVQVCRVSPSSTNLVDLTRKQLDREKVLKEGKAATGKLLIELQVRKSTADGAGARKFYTDLTTPFQGWDGEYRDLVLKKKSACLSLLLYTH